MQRQVIGVRLAIGVALGACKGEERKPETTVTGLTSTIAPAPAAPAEPRPPGESANVPATGAARGRADVTRTLSLDPRASRLQFVAAKLTRAHDGSFRQFAGHLALAGEELRGVDFEVDTGSLETDTEKLTQHVKSKDFLDVERYPKATFVSTSVTPTPGGPGTHSIRGDLTLHGVTRTLSFPVTFTRTPEALTGQGEITIDRQQFGVTYPGMPDDLIKDAVILKPVFVFPVR